MVDGDGTPGGGDTHMVNGVNGVNGNNIVATGDPSAVAAHKAGGPLEKKGLRIANEDRTTTPYMTKYERARVLGTRALQIRLGP